MERAEACTGGGFESFVPETKNLSWTLLVLHNSVPLYTHDA